MTRAWQNCRKPDPREDRSYVKIKLHLSRKRESNLQTKDVSAKRLDLTTNCFLSNQANPFPAEISKRSSPVKVFSGSYAKANFSQTENGFL